MSLILDAYAVIALLKGEPAATFVQELIEHGDCRLTTLGVAEIVDHLVRLVGVEEDQAVLDLAQLGLTNADPLDPTTALRAGLLRARHYHRRTRAVSLADCVLAQSAADSSGAVVTSDPHLLDLCREERIEIIALPDTSGMVWSG